MHSIVAMQPFSQLPEGLQWNHGQKFEAKGPSWCKNTRIHCLHMHTHLCFQKSSVCVLHAKHQNPFYTMKNITLFRAIDGLISSEWIRRTCIWWLGNDRKLLSATVSIPLLLRINSHNCRSAMNRSFGAPLSHCLSKITMMFNFWLICLNLLIPPNVLKGDDNLLIRYIQISIYVKQVKQVCSIMAWGWMWGETEK